MECYRVTLELGSPIIQDRLASFDGLLGWCAVQELLSKNALTGYDDCLDNLPLRKMPFGIDDYVYAASNYFTEGEAAAISKTFINKRFSVEQALKYLPGHAAKINISSGINKSYRIAFTTMSVNQIHYHFSGDADAVEKLLRKWLRGIGKKISIGFGVVKKISITPDKANPLVFRDGEAKRAIPAIAAEDLGVTKGLDRRAMGFYRPPYAPFHPERRAECVIPSESRILGG